MKGIGIFILLTAFIAETTNGQVWKTYLDSASKLDAANNLTAAAEYYSKAIDILKSDSLDTRTHGSVSLKLGNLYIHMAQNEKSEALLNDAIRILEKKDSPEELSRAYDDLGNLYRNTTRHELAEKAYKTGKILREKHFGRMHNLYARSCDNIGFLYQITGRYKEAEQLMLEARLIYEKTSGKQSRNFALNTSNLAMLYVSTGQFEKGLEYMKEGNRLWGIISGTESLDFAVSCNNLGKLYQEIAQFDEAEGMLMTAKKIRGNVLGKTSAPYAHVCNNLGYLYLLMGQHAKAEQLLLEARKIYEKNKNHFNYSNNCESIGTLYNSLGLHEKALPYLVEAEQVRKNVFGNDHPYTILSPVNIATTYGELGRYDTAEILLLHVKKTFEEKIGKDQPGYSEILSNLSFVYRLKKQYTWAEEMALEAIPFGEKEFGKYHPIFSSLSGNLALAYWYQQKDKQAGAVFKELFDARKIQTKNIFGFSAEYEKLAFLESVSQDRQLQYSFSYDRLPAENAGQLFDISLFYRNLVLASVQQLHKNINDNPDTLVKNKYREWRTAKQQLAYWTVKPETAQAEDKIVLEEKAAILEKELTRHSAAFRNEKEKNEITWQAVRERLQHQEAAIEFIDFEYYSGNKQDQSDSAFYMALVLRKDMAEPVMVKLFEKRELERLLMKKSVNERNTINQLYASFELYHLIWQPLEQYLTNISTVFFTPSGLLHAISLAAIKTGDNQTLAEKYQLVQLLSTAVAAGRMDENITLADDLVLYGAVQYDADSASIKKAAAVYHDSRSVTRSMPEELIGEDDFRVFKPLPQSETEISFIAKAAGERKYKVSVFKGAEANEESFKSLDGRASPSVLHFATHAFFYPDPKKYKRFSGETWGKVFKMSDNPLFRGGLVLSGAENTWRGKPVPGVEDGILTAYEVSNMYLPDTKLAVLSACQTGLGDIKGTEGVYGLQRAFKIAGVQNLVMSLWDIDDAAGAGFMQEFYKHLFEGKAVSESFRLAQKTMKAKYTNDPYLWAGFVLIK